MKKKKVADKVPVEEINIKNIANNENKTKIVTNKSKSKVSFKYIIKIADLYFEDSAKILKNRLLIE